MSKKIRWITETAVLLTLLIILQTVTKPLGQLVTGSCVNAVLGLSVLTGGLWSGVTIALVSPIMAFLLGIAPQILTVPAIMAGNTVFVLLLYFIAGAEPGNVVRKVLAWLAAAVAKFVILYAIVAKLICGVLAQPLLAEGVLKEPMLKSLPVLFGAPQLVTALIGGGIALVLFPLIRKAKEKM